MGEAHPKEKGWIEIDAWIEENSEGRYIACRKHEKIKKQEIDFDER